MSCHVGTIPRIQAVQTAMRQRELLATHSLPYLGVLSVSVNEQLDKFRTALHSQQSGGDFKGRGKKEAARGTVCRGGSLEPS
jgi:hypothetical protein